MLFCFVEVHVDRFALGQVLGDKHVLLSVDKDFESV